MRQGWVGVLAGLLLLVVGPASASAHHDRGMTSLDQTAVGDNFVLHYASPTTAEYAATGLADFEESYDHLVAGGGGTPNAQFNAAVNDGDGKTDVYLTSPPGGGGQVNSDTNVAQHPDGSSYVLMDPAMDRRSFRFRAAHEFMHIIQNAYVPSGWSMLFESTANWASEYALPDTTPLDNNFDQPWVPLECVATTWEGADCGSGYGQWIFFQMLSEDFGPDVIEGLLEEQQSICPGLCSAAQMRQVMREEIVDQGGTSLRVSYAQYAREILDPGTPSPWTTSSIGAIHDAFFFGPPAHHAVEQQIDSGTQETFVDHLGTRYLRIKNYGGFEARGPDDQVAITVTRPAGMTGSLRILRRAPGQRGLDPIALNSGTTLGYTADADPAVMAELWIPLVNDTETTDNAQFGYTVDWTAGQPAPPPANDQRSSPQSVSLGVEAVANNVYATGAGATEAPSCPPAAQASRGTWYRFVAPNTGMYTFSSLPSDFRGAVSIYDGATFKGCGAQTAGGSINASLIRGRAIDVYVGRQADAPGDGGTTVRLLVTGPGAPPPPVTTGGGTQTQTPTSTQTVAQPLPPPPLAGPLPGPPAAEGVVPVAGTGTGQCSGAIVAQATAKRKLAAARRGLRRARGSRRRRAAKRKVKRARSALRRATALRESAC